MAGSRSFNVKDLAIIALMTAILFVQEQLLTSLPGIQLTIFLIILFSKKFGIIKTILIIIIHVILDNIYMGSFSLLYTPTMLIGYLIIPISICTLFKKSESPIILAILSIAYSFIYCWLYIIPNYFLIHIDPIAYLASDVLFEIPLAVFSFISTLLLYKPCAKAMDLLMNK